MYFRRLYGVGLTLNRGVDLGSGPLSLRRVPPEGVRKKIKIEERSIFLEFRREPL